VRSARAEDLRGGHQSRPPTAEATPLSNAIAVRRPGARELTVKGDRVIYQVKSETGRNATRREGEILRGFGPDQNRSKP